MRCPHRSIRRTAPACRCAAFEAPGRDRFRGRRSSGASARRYRALANASGGRMRKVLFIFSVLTDADVEWLGQAGERVQADPGTELVAIDARVDHLYFVLDGRLAVKARNGEIIRTLESGEVIGE